MSYSCTCQLWESVITANLFAQTEDGAKMVAGRVDTKPTEATALALHKYVHGRMQDSHTLIPGKNSHVESCIRSLPLPVILQIRRFLVAGTGPFRQCRSDDG
jgi:hypothetical protein